MTTDAAHHMERMRWALAIMDAGLAIHDRIDDVVKGAGLTFNQYVVLGRIIERKGRATVSELAAEGRRAVHTLTSAVNGLEHKKLVQRQSIKGEDRRVIRIEVTEEGRVAFNKVVWPARDTLGRQLLTDQELYDLQHGRRPWRMPPAGRLMGIDEDLEDAARPVAYAYRS